MHAETHAQTSQARGSWQLVDAFGGKVWMEGSLEIGYPMLKDELEM